MAESLATAETTYRYSGHGTFPCRYTWLPKAVRHLLKRPELFRDEDNAMVRLGVGKNMVRAIRCWVTAAGIAATDRAPAMTVTPFGKAVLGPGGYDEFLEDVQTLWLIHWRLSTQVQEPLFAWYYLLNKWNQPEFMRSEVLAAFSKEIEREARPLSSVTLEEHFTVFVHTYVPTRNGKRELIEDSLDCPLVELEFIPELGERSDPKTGQREKIYGFRNRGETRHIARAFCVFCERLLDRSASTGEDADM